MVYYPVVLLEFIHTAEFDRSAADVGFDNGKLRELQRVLCENPETGSVIPGTGGLRKLRFSGRGSGKRGGYRIIYFFVPRRRVMYLLLTYAKGADDDLSDAGKKHLARLARILEVENDV